MTGYAQAVVFQKNSLRVADGATYNIMPQEVGSRPRFLRKRPQRWMLKPGWMNAPYRPV